MEGILLETMFELPTLNGVQEVVITADVVEGRARPLYTYSDKAEARKRARPERDFVTADVMQVRARAKP